MRDHSSLPNNESEVATSSNYELPILSTPTEPANGPATTPISANSALNTRNRLSPSSNTLGTSPTGGSIGGALAGSTAKSVPSSPLHTLTRRFKPPVWRGPQCELHSLAPAELAAELEKQAESILIIDIRPYTMFSLTRVKSAISICIPSTLLKRQTFGFRRIVDFVAPQDVETLQRVGEYSHIIFYDQRTTHCGPESSLRRTAAKFVDADPELAPKLYWLVGGIANVAKEAPELLETDDAVAPPDNETNDKNDTKEEAPKLTISSIRAAPRSPFSLVPVVTAVGTTLRSPFSTPSRQPPLDDSSSIRAEGKIASRLSEFPQWLVNAVQSTEQGENVLAEAFQRLQAAEINRIASGSGTQRHERSEPHSAWLSSHMRVDTPWSSPTTPFSDASALSITSSTTTSPMELKHEYAHKQRVQQSNQFHRRNASRDASRNTSPVVPPNNRKVFSDSLCPLPMSGSTGHSKHSPATSEAADITQFAIVAGNDPRKNRYTNIAPFYHNRVVVRGSEYLNASYIRSSLSRLQYIATQAPVPAAFGDFWWCVFEHRVPLIIMLTTLRTESGQVKGNKYWFDSNYDGLEVRLVEEHFETINGNVNGLAVRHIELRHNDMVHTVVHFQYENWPDLGCPADPTDVLDLVEQKKLLMQHAESEDSFVVVHCSAGCGRTGTFCTIDTVTDFLSKLSPQEAREDPEDRVLRAVSEFREQRMAMVQNQRQLLLCYEAVMIWCFKQLENK